MSVRIAGRLVLLLVMARAHAVKAADDVQQRRGYTEDREETTNGDGLSDEQCAK